MVQWLVAIVKDTRELMFFFFWMIKRQYNKDKLYTSIYTIRLSIKRREMKTHTCRRDMLIVVSSMYV